MNRASNERVSSTVISASRATAATDTATSFNNSSHLPLRLQVEPIIRAEIGISNCFVLPSKDEERVCIIISSENLVAIAIRNVQDISLIAEILELESVEAVPEFIYALETAGWYDKNGGKLKKPPNKSDICEQLSARSTLNIDVLKSIARIVVESIHRYYSRQVLGNLLLTKSLNFDIFTPTICLMFTFSSRF